MQRLPRWPAALGVALLAACSTAPEARRDAPRTAVPPAPPAARPAPVPPVPRDLASIPDAVPRAEPRSRYGNPPSYVVFGRRYFLLASSQGYVERGTASWYGPGFHAARTSSGEPYDMYGMTAAHKTLPIPAYARVTNLRNGRSVVVRINDRGPFVGDRLIDLSYTAAWKLDMLRTGTAPVEVRVLSPDGDLPPVLTASAAPATAAPVAASATARTPPLAPATTPPAEPPAALPAIAASPVPPLASTAGGAAAIAAAAAPRTMLQAGAFFSEANARSLIARLGDAGIGNAVMRSSRAGARTVWQVRVGPLETSLEVDDMLERLRLAGVANVRRVVE